MLEKSLLSVSSPGATQAWSETQILALPLTILVSVTNLSEPCFSLLLDAGNNPNQLLGNIQ